MNRDKEKSKNRMIFLPPCLIIAAFFLVGCCVHLYGLKINSILHTTTLSDNIYPKFTGSRISLSKSKRYVSGTFGKLELTEQLLEPTISYVRGQTDLQDMAETFQSSCIWSFPNATKSRLHEIFISSGANAAVCEALEKSSSYSSALKGYIVQPDEKLRLSLPAVVRNNLYNEVAAYSQNPMYSDPLCFNSPLLTEWYEKSKLSSALQKLLNRLCYQKNGIWYLSDTDIIMSHLHDETEFESFVQTIYRVRTMNACLLLNRGQNLNKLAAYWGAMGRQSAVLKLFQAALRNNVSAKINVASLLPVIPSGRLYTYSGQSEYSESFKDCHWTTLNFFNKSPDQNYYKLTDVNAYFRQMTTPVQNSRLRFGDIITIFKNNRLVHSCTFIAGNLVLTKDGMGTLMPFILGSLNSTVSLYGDEVAYARRTVSYTNTLKIN